MKPPTLLLLLQQTLLLLTTTTLLLPTTKSDVISSTHNRLPMSLSTIISDLEAEGVSQLSTATFLTSRSVSKSDRCTLLRSLFDLSVEEEDTEATAFGKKFGDDDEEGIGIAVANPCAAPGGGGGGGLPGEVASTVLATHGTVIYSVSEVDLERGEGLFESLAPAVERLLWQHHEEEEEGKEGEKRRSAELIVILQGVRDKQSAKKKFEKRAADMLSTIVQPENGRRGERMEDIFDTVEYLTSEEAETSSVLMNTLVGGQGQLLEPADAASSVAAAVSLGMIDPWGGGDDRSSKKFSAVDLAAMRKLGPASESALNSALSTVKDVAEPDDGDGERSSPRLIPDFGRLCDAAIQQSMQKFDKDVGPFLLKRSAVARRKRKDLFDEIVTELGELQVDQLQLFKLAQFEKFRGELSKLRVGPTLPDDMDEALQNSVRDFAIRVRDLYVKLRSNTWPSPAIAKSNYRTMLKEYCTDRLQAARVSGSYRPVPRKGVTVGLHWLLPKPFGNDFRQVATDIYRGDLVYTPKDKVTEVNKEEVEKGTGDWRRSVVPVPAAPEMMYQPGSQ